MIKTLVVEFIGSKSSFWTGYFDLRVHLECANLKLFVIRKNEVKYRKFPIVLYFFVPYPLAVAVAFS